MTLPLSGRGDAVERRRHATYRTGFLLGAVGGLVLFCMTAAVRVLATESIDAPVSLALNAWARRSRILDHALQGIASLDLFQGMPVMALACGAFAASRRGRARSRLAIAVAGAGLAAVFSRLLQEMMISLSRPLVDPTLPFLRPYGGSPEIWRDWSSFPSDHATLVWGVAIATFLANPRIGAISFLAATVSSFARLYCGLHYLTDILAGALLSSFVVCSLLALGVSYEDRLAAFGSRRPALVGTVAFLFGAQAAMMFSGVRVVAQAAAPHFGAIFTSPAQPRGAAEQSCRTVETLQRDRGRASPASSRFAAGCGMRARPLFPIDDDRGGPAANSFPGAGIRFAIQGFHMSARAL